MSTFKDRLLEEKTQLFIKIEKLDSFIQSDNFKNVAPVQQSLLTVQRNAMVTYDKCLEERLVWLQKEEQ